MKWSIQELFRDLKQIFERRLVWRKVILFLPIDLIYVVQHTFYWIFTGVTKWNAWEIDVYLARVISYRLKLRIKRYIKSQRKDGLIWMPNNVENLTEWMTILNDIVVGYEAYLVIVSDVQDPNYPDFDYRDAVDSIKHIEGANYMNMEEYLDQDRKQRYEEYRARVKKYDQDLQEKYLKGSELFNKYHADLWD